MQKKSTLTGIELEKHKAGTFFAYRPGNPRDPYQRPAFPHHVHKANGCVDHRDCPDDHWIGGRPESTHPHHVEIDVSSGAAAYTRLATDEIADLTVLDAFLDEQATTAVAVEDARMAQLKARAATDPDFAALAELMGVDLSTPPTVTK